MPELTDAEVVTDDELVFDDSLGSTLVRRERTPACTVREGDLLAGKYRVERIPGRAGLGVIAQVRHLELGQEVTLKFLSPDACAYPEFVQRFIREARAAVKLGGEHVARVTDVGRLESGAPYMVREHLRGPDLAEVLRVRGALPVSEAVDYIVQAAEGVAEGHALGIVHRNLRPTTLVVCRRSDGTPLVKVFDFAAAEALHVDPFTERAVSLVGTSAIMAALPYLSPEQIRDPLDVDARADVYALGAVLHELLTGSPVYRGENAPSLLAAVAADVAPAVRSSRSDAPAELDHVVLRCLAKNRGLRYSTMGDLVSALAPFASKDAQLSIERVERLARQSSVPQLAPRSVAPRTQPLPAGESRGPSGTLMMQKVASCVRPQPSITDDVTVAQPLHDYEPLADERARQRAAEPARAPEPPRERRRSTPPPMPAESAPASPRNEAAYAPPHRPQPTSHARTTLVPPARSSLPGGVSRSWMPDSGNTAVSKVKSRRMVSMGVIAACSVLGLSLGISATTGTSNRAAATLALPAASTLSPVVAPATTASQRAPASPVTLTPATVGSTSPVASVAAPAPTAPARAVADMPPPGGVARIAAPSKATIEVAKPRPAKVAAASTPAADLFSSPD